MMHTNPEEPPGGDSFERYEQDRYERVFRAATRLPENWYPMTDDRERFLDAARALEYGLADEVVPVWGTEARLAPAASR